MSHNLKTVTIPYTAEEITTDTFYDCPKLNGINVLTENTSIYVPFTPQGLEFIKTLKNGLDYSKYDSLFYSANKEMKTNMAFFRLFENTCQNETAEEVYKKHLFENSLEIAEDLIEKNDIAKITFMGETKLLPKENTEYLIEFSSKKDSLCTGYLIEYKHENFGKVQSARNRFRL